MTCLRSSCVVLWSNSVTAVGKSHNRLHFEVPEPRGCDYFVRHNGEISNSVAVKLFSRRLFAVEYEVNANCRRWKSLPREICPSRHTLFYLNRHYSSFLFVLNLQVLPLLSSDCPLRHQPSRRRRSSFLHRDCQELALQQRLDDVMIPVLCQIQVLRGTVSFIDIFLKFQRQRASRLIFDLKSNGINRTTGAEKVGMDFRTICRILGEAKWRISGL